MHKQTMKTDNPQPAAPRPSNTEPKAATLVCTERHWSAFRNHLIQPDRLERAAFMLLGRNKSGDAITYYVHRLFLVPDDRCLQQHGAIVEPDTECILENFLRYSKSQAVAFLHAHSHPFSSRARFSGTDDYYLPEEIQSLANYLDVMSADCPRRFARVVAGQEEGGFTAEVYDETCTYCERITAVNVVGRNGIRTIDYLGEGHPERFSGSTSAMTEADRKRLDRNLNWLGEAGQQKIVSTHIALCGVGGLGAEVMKNCRGLGFKRFTLIDMDRIETSNMNRLPYPASSIGKYKVDAARDFLLEAVPDAEIVVVNRPVEYPSAQEALLEADFIVSSLDDDGARLSAQILAARHLKPLLDLGSGISLKPGQREVAAMGGQAIFYAPGEACLVCQGLDPSTIVPREIRKLHRQIGYVQNTDETPASVVTINSVMGGVAGDLIMKYLTGFSSIPSWVSYDLFEHKTVTMSFQRRSDCPICGDDGIGGLGTDTTKPIEAPHYSDHDFVLPVTEEEFEEGITMPLEHESAMVTPINEDRAQLAGQHESANAPTKKHTMACADKFELFHPARQKWA